MSLADVQAGIAAALVPLAGQVPDLQVVGFLNSNPTPPSLDVYPADPFLDGAGFGVDSQTVYFTVRARVSTADEEAGQRLLLRLLDTGDTASVEQALGAAGYAVTPEGVSGFREYLESIDGGRLLGCEWRVQTYM